jgi:hypothetical protein
VSIRPREHKKRDREGDGRRSTVGYADDLVFAAEQTCDVLTHVEVVIRQQNLGLDVALWLPLLIVVVVV